VPPPRLLASSRPRRPGACGAEAGVKGPGGASSRICRCAPSAATLSLAPAADAANLRRSPGSGHSAMRLSLLQIMEVTGGGEVGGTQVGNMFSTFHTDSREVSHGGVFFALRGAEMDGHRFVGDAIDRGAAAVVVDRRMGIP